MVEAFSSGIEENPKMFGRVVIYGLGMMGASLAAALKKRNLVETVVATSRSEKTLAKGLKLGIVDEVFINPAEAMKDADIVVLCMPVGIMEICFAQIKGFLEPQTVITDVGSVKGFVVQAARNVFDPLPKNFVPSHPIAGSEKSGVAAFNENLYVAHKVIVTPVEESSLAAIARTTQLWQSVGADVSSMPVKHHDDVLAATSHLPHLLAFSLVDTLAKESDNNEIFHFAAGGFRDFTRIAASDPTMWKDIFISNKESVLKVLDHFDQTVASVREMIKSNDETNMLGVFTRAKEARNYFSALNEKKAYTQLLNQQGDIHPMSSNNSSSSWRVLPASKIQGTIRVPGDKSISHRSIMLGALAEGITEVEGFLEGEDALATLQAFRNLGVVIEGPENGRVKIHGVGLHGLQAPVGDLYMGNSGTSMRLLSGLMAAQSFDVTLAGDESLSKRPMERVAKPLREMGAKIDTVEKGRPPMVITGDQALKGVHYEMPMASAQVKSCVLLAGLYAEGETSVVEPAPTRDHTERMLRGFGYEVQTDDNKITLQGGGKLTATTIDIPADISSSAFFMVAASIAPNSQIMLQHVGMNPTRIGVVNILRAMGADITLHNERLVGGEPVADIEVKSAALKGIEIPQDQVPLAIDEFPVIFIAAACAEGETILRGAEELRVKESDRIQVMADGLAALGIDAKPTEDGIVIQGKGHADNKNDVFTDADIVSHGDHRIAMSFTVASLRAAGDIRIQGAETVATSFPSFVQLAQAVGLSIEVSA